MVVCNDAKTGKQLFMYKSPKRYSERYNRLYMQIIVDGDFWNVRQWLRLQYIIGKCKN